MESQGLFANIEKYFSTYNRQNDEIMLHFSKIWFRMVQNEVPFFKLPELLIEEDIWFNQMFMQPPLNYIPSLTRGSLFFNANMLLTKNMDRHFPPEKLSIVSRLHFNESGQPHDLTRIFNSCYRSFREYLIINYILKKSALLKSLYPDFLFGLGNLIENNYSRDPAANLDVALPAEIFVRLVTIFRDQLPLLYYDQLVYSPLYQKIAIDMQKELDKIEIDFTDEDDIFNKDRMLLELAVRFTHEIDKSTRYDLKNYHTAGGTQPFIPGRVLFNNNYFGFIEDNDEQVLETYTREVIGIIFTVKIIRARSLQNKFEQLQNKLKNHTEEISREIFKLKSRYRQKKSVIGYSGVLNEQRAWRKNLEQVNFFVVNENSDRPGNIFNVVFLIDNSCSIPSKINTLQHVLALLVSVICRHPDLFREIIAYAQKGTGKAVYLTPLVTGPVRKVKDFGPILYFNCNKVNYDPFALFEILVRHEKTVLKAQSISLIFLVGDAWPVSLENNQKEEAKAIMGLLRGMYPNSVIIYFATNPTYKPEELGYDYYVNLTADRFDISDFISQFKKIILRIIEDYGYSRFDIGKN